MKDVKKAKYPKNKHSPPPITVYDTPNNCIRHRLKKSGLSHGKMGEKWTLAKSVYII